MRGIGFSKRKIFSGALQILIPLYLTYIIFAVSVFFVLLPYHEKQLLSQKKETIQHLTNSVISILTEYDNRIKQETIAREDAFREAIDQIRHIRYGPKGKDYFWINDMHPFMIMHPYRPDLEGRDLTLLKDEAGNFPFIAMVETVIGSGGGFVDYFWQWKDASQKVVPKISYVQGFSPWGWIIGTGIYVDDVQQEIWLVSKKTIQIFAGVLIFILILSVYITTQTFRIEQKKTDAERSRELEELRLKKLLELSQMANEPNQRTLEFALNEAIKLTQSEIGYLALLSEDESRATIKTLSHPDLKHRKMEDRKLVYNIDDIGIWSELVRSHKPLTINDFSRLSRDLKKGFPEKHIDISRVLNIPVLDGTKVVAISGVGNKKTDYTESDIRQIKLIMDGLWKIIQRKKTERDLRDSERRYRLLADNATDVISIIQLPDLTYTYVSPSIKNLIGYSADELVGTKAGENMTEESRKKISQILSAAPQSEKDREFRKVQVIELEMIKKDRSKIWGEVSARFLRGDSGTQNQILSITRDISERKKIEENLESLNTDLVLAQRISGVGNWAFNPDTGVITWSEEIYRIFEQDPGLGPYKLKEFEEVFHEKWWKRYKAAIDASTVRGRPFDIELKLELPSQRKKWVNIICEPEIMKNSDLYFLRGTIQDISGRKEMERQIQQGMKMEALGTLAGGIAHDFNNILSAIFGFAELAKMGAGDDKELTDSLDQILASGIRAKELVKHILTFSRKADVQREIMPLVPLLKENLKFLRASTPANIEIKSNIKYTDINILADPTQMHQVLMNLFTNAVHAMKPDGGTLTVSLEGLHISDKRLSQLKELEPGQYGELTISDTGHGIPKNLIGRIFEPFFTTKVKGEGTGMGLSQVYGIIKSMQGHISVSSKPDKGTSFHIIIPQHEKDPSKSRNSKQNGLIRGKGKILFVDDELPIVEWSTQVLLGAGYKVAAFSNEEKALKRFRQTADTFDLVLTDLSMKKMTGIQLSRQIKKIRPDIPIILCTGFSEGITNSSMERHGISQVLMKPVIAGELTQVISDCLDKK